MILVDPRERETKSLTHHIRGLGQPCEERLLNSGDFFFYGNGPNQTPWRVGIERKNIGDLVNSMDNGRLTGLQLPRLKDDYDVIYLLIEGAMRRIRTGDLMGDLEFRFVDKDWTRPIKPVSWFGVTNFLTTLEAKAGLNVRFSFSPYDSACQVVALHSWWTEKTWEEHRAHLNVYTQKRGEVVRAPEAIVRMLNSLRCGVGEKIARRAAECFGTPKKMVLAEEKDWYKVEGVGEKLAAKLVGLFRGKERKQ